MTREQFDEAHAAFCRRQPFRRFRIKFVSGNETIIRHPKAIRREGESHLARMADGGYVVFAAEAVCRVLDVPRAGGK